MADPRILRIFISYAHEDAKIAIAVFNALQSSLDNTLSEVFLDIMSLEAGSEFKTKIEDQLEKTDVLIIIYTGTEKLSHSYTGFEVGYFRAVQRSRRAAGSEDQKIVSLYLRTPPSTESGIEGVAFGIGLDALGRSAESFRENLEAGVDDAHPMVRFFDGLKDLLARIRIEGGFPKGQPTDTVGSVREMLMAVFLYLKTTVEKTMKPQKQITITTSTAALEAAEGNLPGDALLAPIGSGGPMSVFALPEAQVEWDDFLRQTMNHKMSLSWREAINSVVSSSVQNQIEVDNSQVICSSDDAHLYRLILTTGTTYFNGKREFNIYLVEALRPKDYGNRDTTLLLKGLGMVCRFRFLFLEQNSEFYANNILTVALAKLPPLARHMIRELDMLMRAAVEAGFDQPSVWSEFVDWPTIKQMNQEWVRHEPEIRRHAALISASTGDAEERESLRQQLARTIEAMAVGIEPHNRSLIEQMSDKLKSTVKRDQRQQAKPRQKRAAGSAVKLRHSGRGAPLS